MTTSRRVAGRRREAEPQVAAPEPVGREGALGHLRRAVDEAVTGRGRLVLITGEAGIGKTTLLAYAARYADSLGLATVWALGWPGQGAPAYWPWAQVLRGLGVGELPHGPVVDDAPAAARFQKFDMVSSLVLGRAAERPLLVLLDDLQWADVPSLLLLDLLSRRLPTAPCVVVGSHRDVDRAARPELSALAARGIVLPLAGLSEPAVGELARRLAGHELPAETIAAMHQRTGGNPFFVEQVSLLAPDGPADGGTGLPPGVREVLDQRLAGLAPEHVHGLGVAAAAGRPFPASLLARAGAGSSDEVAAMLAAASRAGAVVGAAEGFRFVHDLFREYAYERLDPARRAAVHLGLAEALEADRDRGEDVGPAELADHFARADPAGAPARRYSVEAAHEAAGRLAYEQAVRHWTDAYAAAGADAADRAALLLELGHARRRAGALEGAADAFWRVAALARRSGDASGLAHAALGLHSIGTVSAELSAGLVALLTETLDAFRSARPEVARPGAPAAGPPPAPSAPSPEVGVLRARVMAALARILSWHDIDVARAREIVAEAVADARAAGDPRTLAECLVASHNVLWHPATIGQRRQIAAEIAGLADALRDSELLMEAKLLAAADALEDVDPAFRQPLDEFLRLAEASGQPRHHYAATIRRATLAFFAGRFDENERLIEKATVIAEECGEIWARNIRGEQRWELYSAQGRRSELTPPPVLTGHPQARAARGFRALLALSAGVRDDPELAELLAGWESDPDRPPPDSRRWVADMVYTAEFAVLLGDTAFAARVYDLLLPYAGKGVVVGAFVTFKGAIDHHLGLLAAATGRPGVAADHFARAVRVHDALGIVPWSLRSHVEAARLRLADPTSRTAGAEELASLATEARRIGMAGLATDAEAAAVRTGGTAALFVRHGAMWTLAFGGLTVRLRDAKGLRDLAALIAVPGQEVAAADLVAAGGAEAARADLGLGADEVFDERARREIRGRLADLDEEITEAEQWADGERAARARAEREAIMAELAAATGLGGAGRRLGDQWERARKAATARIRDAIGRIDRVHPALAAHLRTSVTTGTYCSYSPPMPVDWRL